MNFLMAKANIQIPIGMLMDVYHLLSRLEDYDLDESTQKLCRSLEDQIQSKLDAMEKRNAYTKYKTSVQGSDERATAREVYLEKAGITKNFRSEKEISNENL